MQIIGQIPSECTIACSGGVDSMAVAAFFKQGRKTFKLAFFNHLTEHSNKSEEFLTDYFGKEQLIIGRIQREKKKEESLEEYWRNERYTFFKSISGPIVAAHHLDDAVETWIFTSLHGKPKIIPYQHKNVIRPFLMVEKKDLMNLCIKTNTKWIEDESNKNNSFARNRIRNVILPEVMKISPGIKKIIRKKYLNEI